MSDELAAYYERRIAELEARNQELNDLVLQVIVDRTEESIRVRAGKCYDGGTCPRVQEGHVMQRCTECGRIYGYVDDASPLGELNESHGICPDCAGDWEALLEQELAQGARDGDDEA